MLDSLLNNSINQKRAQYEEKEKVGTNTPEDNTIGTRGLKGANNNDEIIEEETIEEEIIEENNEEEEIVKKNDEENGEKEEKEIDGNADEKIEEIIKRMQAEADRRVNEALEKERKKAEREKELAAMDEKERYEALLKEREEEIKKKEYEIEKLEVSNIVKNKMIDSGLGDLVDMINIESYVGKNKEEIENDLEKIIGGLNNVIKVKLEKEKETLLGSYGKQPNNTNNKKRIKKNNKSNLDSFLDNLKL